MPKFYIDEVHLGSEATQEQAEQLVRILQTEGWDVEYGSGFSDATEDEKLSFESAFYKALEQVAE